MKYLKIELIAETHFLCDEDSQGFYTKGLSVKFSKFRKNEAEILQDVSIDKKACRERITEVSFEIVKEKYKEALRLIENKLNQKS